MPRCIPDFTDEGLLPPGDYEVTFDQLRASVLVHGLSESSPWYEGWNATWREDLTFRAESMCQQLWAVGVDEIFLNGSFVEAKAHPNDIDGYFSCDVRRVATGELQRSLNQIDPRRYWTWDPSSRRPYRGYAKRQLPMWHAYRVELYPHYHQLSGITDERGYALTFPSAFRQRRSDGRPKGIVKVVPEGPQN